mgnify:CR=1 FL=1
MFLPITLNDLLLLDLVLPTLVVLLLMPGLARVAYGGCVD